MITLILGIIIGAALMYYYKSVVDSWLKKILKKKK